MSDEVLAKFVEDKDGNIILSDPSAYGVMIAVESHNRGINRKSCRQTYDENKDRVAYFKQRVIDRDLSVKDWSIVIIAVDDSYGTELANILMPNTDWQPFRDMGQKPIARGFASKEGLVDYISLFDKNASEDLKSTDKLCCVVIDFNTVLVIPV